MEYVLQYAQLDGEVFIVTPFTSVMGTPFIVISNKKAVLSQGNRAMQHVFPIRQMTLWLLFASVYERSRPLYM